MNTKGIIDVARREDATMEDISYAFQEYADGYILDALLKDYLQRTNQTPEQFFEGCKSKLNKSINELIDKAEVSIPLEQDLMERIIKGIENGKQRLVNYYNRK